MTYSDDYHDGYKDGYEDGYHDACEQWQRECQQLRDTLRAMLEMLQSTEARPPRMR